jgi:hypothetical protein
MKRWMCAELLFCLLLAGCCDGDHSAPSLPQKTYLGWNDNGFRSGGRFVLRKGEATDNGRVQVKVLDILSDNSCPDRRPDPAFQVVFQFTRMSDQKILCSGARPESSHSFLISFCGNELVEFGISGCVVKTINLKENWVFFELL